jgi:archaellum component FlaC
VDLKTLEYMEARTKKAREIVKKIDTLKKNIETVEKVYSVLFMKTVGPDFDSSLGDFTEELTKVYVELASSEIEVLEKELAEL